ncbi:hypothetical protein D3C71_947220 [compost metagenome]
MAIGTVQNSTMRWQSLTIIWRIGKSLMGKRWPGNKPGMIPHYPIGLWIVPLLI